MPARATRREALVFTAMVLAEVAACSSGQSGSTGTPTSGTTSAPTPAPLVVHDVVGAIGDGVADDTGALLDSMARAREGSGRIRLGRGRRYRVSSPVDVSGLVVLGNGSFLLASYRPRLVVLSLSGRTSVRDLSVVVDGPPQRHQREMTGVGVSIRGNDYVDLTNVTVVGVPGDGIAVLGDESSTAPTSARRLIVRDCSARRCTRGLRVHKVASFTITGGHFSDNTNLGLQIDQARSFVVDGVTALSNGSAGAPAGDGCAVLYSMGFRITALHASRNTRRGLSLGGGSQVLPANMNWRVDGVECRANGEHGITIDPTVRGSEGIPVASNGVVEGAHVLDNGANGINVTCASLVLLKANTCSGNRADGLAIASSKITVTANSASGNTGHGIALYGGTDRPRYGGHKLAGNMLTGNRAGDFYVSPLLVVPSTVNGEPTR